MFPPVSSFCSKHHMLSFAEENGPCYTGGLTYCCYAYICGGMLPSFHKNPGQGEELRTVKYGNFFLIPFSALQQNSL